MSYYFDGIRKETPHNATQIKFSADAIKEAAEIRLLELKELLDKAESNQKQAEEKRMARTAAREEAERVRKRQHAEWERRNAHRWFAGTNPFEDTPSFDGLIYEYPWPLASRKIKENIDRVSALVVLAGKSSGDILLSEELATLVFIPRTK